MKRNLHWWILGGMGAGIAIGAVLHGWVPDPVAVKENWLYEAMDGIGSIFLRLLKMIVAPLVIFSLLSGLMGLGSLRRLGRLGSRTFGLYILTSMLAIVMGLFLVNVIGPGVGVVIEVPQKPGELIEKESGVPESAWDVVLNMIPENFIRSVASLDLIGVIFFTLLFGTFLIALPDDRKAPLVGLIEACCDVMMRMTGWVISLAPIGIAGLIARMVATTGPEVLLKLAPYVLTVFLALSAHVLITLPTLIWLFTRRNPYRFLKAMSPALLTGFSSASSSGTLGVTMTSIEKTGVSNRAASFVLPLGATINMDGTALYEIVTVLFIAQMHATANPDFTLTLGSQLMIVFLGLAVSIGAAGIPHAGLVMMVIILEAVGLPVGYTALIWTVDRVLDMCRTAVNISSDSTVAMIVANAEGEIDPAVMWEK